MSSLAIVATHPIQYYVPIYRALAASGKVSLKVFYHRFPSDAEQGKGFNVPFQWDIDLLSGYEYTVGPEGFRELVHGMQNHHWKSVMVHGWHSRFYRRIIREAGKTGVPLMVRGDSHLHSSRIPWLRWLRGPIYRNFLSRFSVCLAVGTWNAQYYRRYGVPGHRIVMAPHCVDNARIAEQVTHWRTQRRELRQHWGIAPKHFVVMFAGKMLALKRAGDLIRALKLIHDKRPDLDIHALLVGDGAMRDEWAKLALEHRIRATFTGFLNQSDMPKAYAVSDCLVLPSRSETWGLVINEALACGVPCIVSDKAGCTADILLQGVNGLIYPCGKIPRLADRIEALASGELRLHCESEAAREQVQRHSPESAAQGILRGVQICKG